MSQDNLVLGAKLHIDVVSAGHVQLRAGQSADHQLANAHVKAVFRQTGYEHQTSYQNDHAIASTLYSIVRIALQAQ